jgi:small acid-soluble spore protein F (minor alpha/beta-type SASP)
MSEELKYELAKDLGFYDTVQKEGWGGIRAKDAGNMVKRALQIAEKTLAEQARAQTRGAAPQATTVATAGAGRAATMTAQAPLVSTTYAATRTVGAQPTTSQPLGRYRP